jgi:CBS domain-containing protein
MLVVFDKVPCFGLCLEHFCAAEVGVLERGGHVMQVSAAMTCDVHLANPRQTICDAATIMAELDAGVVPVGENDRLVGMSKDRDIRAIAKEEGPDTKIGEAREVSYCFEDDDIDSVLDNLGDLQIRRLPVLDRGQAASRHSLARCCGGISNGDGSAGAALAAISCPGGKLSQT